MANRNTQGFGLVPAGTLGGSPSIQGQGKYKIDAGYTTTIYNGGAVKSAAGYIVEGQGSAAPVIGVLNGIFYNAATTLKPTFSNFYKQPITPANSEDIDAFVIDNPTQQYVVATDLAAAQSLYLETFDMNASAGSDTTGKSSATLDIGTTGADDKQYRLLRSAEDPENDENAIYRSVVVVANLLELQS
jgi:hypothetical protein